MKAVIMAAIVLVVFWCEPATGASFDLNGDGKPETDLISRCGKLIARKQTITHQIKNGLKERVVVTWPAAGISQYSAPKAVTSTVLTYETYKSCVPSDDKGVEFTTSKGKRKFDQGGAAVKPGFIVAEIVKAIEQMELGKLKEIFLEFRTIFDGKQAVTVSSHARGTAGQFEYAYRVENKSSDEVLVTIPDVKFEVVVRQGATEERVRKAQHAPEESPTRIMLKSKDYELDIAVPLWQPPR